MADLNYSGNSDSAKNRKPKPQMVTCEVKGQSETKAGKLKSIFIAEDVANVRDWIWNTAIVPNVKTGLCDLAGTIGDILVNSFCMIITGTPSRNGPRNRPGNGRFNYGACFVEPKSGQVEPRTQNEQNSANRNVDTNFIFPTKADAELILQYLLGELQEYGSATISDLYDAIGKSLPGNWQASNVGWDDLSQAYIQRSSGGWMLVLPRPKRL